MCSLSSLGETHVEPPVGNVASLVITISLAKKLKCFENQLPPLVMKGAVATLLTVPVATTAPEKDES